jgi:beta-lactamase class A
MGAARFIASILLVATGAFAGAVPARAAPLPNPNARKQLEGELARIAQSSGGALGVSALDLESGERVQLNAAERYPMASTFKVAVAVKLLDEVDHGRLALDDTVAIDGGNLSPGSGEIKHTRPDGQRSAKVGELLGYMMRESDNTATDILLERVGGVGAVALHLRNLGIDEMDVSRPTAQLVADAWGFKLPRAGERSWKTLQQLQNRVPAAARQASAQRFLADGRDTTTPDAMVALLELLQRGKALQPASTQLLLDHMENCRTGPRRLKGELPRGMVVAHKTGTFTRVATNDVGIIRLPWNGGNLVVAIYLKGSPLPIADQERAIAYATRALYRYFTR